MNKRFSRNIIIILSIIATVLVCVSAGRCLFVYNTIESSIEDDYAFADYALTSNSDRICEALSDLEKAIFIDKYLVFWNDNAFLQKSYRLQGRIYNSLKNPDPQNALRAFYNCEQLMLCTDDYDRKEYLNLEYMIGLCYKNLHEEDNAKEHFNNCVEGYRELFQENPNESIIEDYQLFLRAYMFLAASDYALGDYESAFNGFALFHGSILESARWEFSSHRYNNSYPLFLIIASDYAAKSADMIGDESSKNRFERQYEIYRYLLDYEEEHLLQSYSLFFPNNEND